MTCATGGNHSIFLDHQGKVWGCGSDTRGQLGYGIPCQYKLCHIRDLNTKIKFVACARDHSLFLDEDGSVWFLGAGAHTNSQAGPPIKYDIGVPITFLSAADTKVMFVDEEGSVWAYGNNSCSSLSLPEKKTYQVPTRILDIPRIIMVSCGTSHSLFLDVDHGVWSCGENHLGELGLGDQIRRTQATKIEMEWPAIKRVHCFTNHSMFLDIEGNVWTTGDNSDYQLGLGWAVRNIWKPRKIPGLPPVRDIACGMAHSLLADEEGSAWSFGCNSHGQLGLGDKKVRDVPTKLPKLSRVSGVVASSLHSFFIEEDGSVWASGWNLMGQLSLSNSWFTNAVHSSCKKSATKIPNLKLAISPLDFPERVVKSARGAD